MPLFLLFGLDWLEGDNLTYACIGAGALVLFLIVLITVLAVRSKKKKKALKAIKTEELAFVRGIEKLIVFDSRYVPNRDNAAHAQSDKGFRYCENAEGMFENLATDSDIARLFEEWRAIVLRHHRLEQLEGEEDFYRRINE